MSKRIISIILISAILMWNGGFADLWASTGTSAQKNPSKSDQSDVSAVSKEIDEAVKLGLVPDGWLKDMLAHVTYSQMANLVLTAMSKKVLSVNPVTKAWVSASSKGKILIKRGEAATIIYRAALENYYGVADAKNLGQYDAFEYAITLDSYHNRCGEAMPIMEHKLFNQGKKVDESYGVWPCAYVALQIDLTNQLPVMDVNKDNYLRVGELLTRQEAVLAAKRLFNAFFPLNDISISKASDFVLKLSDKELKKALTLPAASWNSLPAWRGHGEEQVYSRSAKKSISNVIFKDDFVQLNYFGFNFMRVMAYDLFDYKKDGTLSVSKTCLENLDNAIRYGIEYGIHVDICLTGLKGFAGASGDIAGYTDNKLLKGAQDAYKLLAHRYKNVPNNAVSFNLFNEPWGMDEKDEQTYADAVRAVSRAIRTESPERLIIADGLSGSQKPVYSLAKDKVAQSLHMYGPDHFMTVGWNPDITWYVGQQWPLPYVSGRLNENENITLKGHFTKGTQLNLLCVSGEKVIKGALKLYADGKLAQSIAIDYNSEKGIGPRIFTFNVNTAAKELKITWAAGPTDEFSPISFESIAVVYPGKSSKGTPYISSPWMDNGERIKKMLYQKIDVITCDYTGNNCGTIPAEQAANPVVTIADDGSYTAETEAGYKYAYDLKYFRQYLAPWVEFSKSTGVDFAVLEWGPYAIDTIPAAASYAYTKDAAAAMAEYGIPWCYWADYLDTERLDVTYENYQKHKLDRGIINSLKSYLKK